MDRSKAAARTAAKWSVAGGQVSHHTSLHDQHLRLSVIV